MKAARNYMANLVYNSLASWCVCVCMYVCTHASTLFPSRRKSPNHHFLVGFAEFALARPPDRVRREPTRNKQSNIYMYILFS